MHQTLTQHNVPTTNQNFRIFGFNLTTTVPLSELLPATGASDVQIHTGSVPRALDRRGYRILTGVAKEGQVMPRYAVVAHFEAESA
ncbi:MAG: hypothetical protein GXP37_15670 [Chloroflexi bacterium]|nr:hypothetical protein [Chloroflexota bacterium]